VSDLTALRSHFYGEVFTEDSPGYDAAHRPLDPGFQRVFPRVVLRCRSGRTRIPRSWSRPGRHGHQMRPTK
jgi:hypothetical protein